MFGNKFYNPSPVSGLSGNDQSIDTTPDWMKALDQRKKDRESQSALSDLRKKMLNSDTASSIDAV
jgi:hypothetical protein